MLEVVDPGFGLALQDRGRPALARYGVPPAGALDAWGHAVACILAGASGDAVSAEVTFGGAELAVLETCALALGGADLGAELDGGERLAPDRVHRLRAGSRLRFTGPPGRGSGRGLAGARAYLCLAGGIESERVLGSAATLATAGLGGFGGRGAAPGDRLVPARRGDLGSVGHAWPEGTAPHPAATRDAVRFVAGPDERHLPSGTAAAFAEATWTVLPASDRMGLRLAGPPLDAGAEILSHPLVPGAVQLPAGGGPLVILADGPTIGGYPVVGVVARADLPRLGQARPGDPLRFQPVTAEAARVAWLDARGSLDRVAAALAGDALWHRLPGDQRG